VAIETPQNPARQSLPLTASIARAYNPTYSANIWPSVNNRSTRFRAAVRGMPDSFLQRICQTHLRSHQHNAPHHPPPRGSRHSPTRRLASRRPWPQSRRGEGFVPKRRAQQDGGRAMALVRSAPWSRPPVLHVLTLEAARFLVEVRLILDGNRKAVSGMPASFCERYLNCDSYYF